MIQDTLRFAADQVARGLPCALLTVTETRGSSPAGVGQMMAVLENGESAGTIGGGASENQIREEARQAIREGKNSFTFSCSHNESGMTCGGGMSGTGVVLLAGPRLVIFGGGHVAQSVAPLAQSAGFAVTVVEDRPELEAYFQGVRYVLATPEDYAEKVYLGREDYVLIATRGHRSDKDALAFCLGGQTHSMGGQTHSMGGQTHSMGGQTHSMGEQTHALGGPPAYVGMIGSKRKVAEVYARLLEEGAATREELAGVYSPVGLDIASKHPGQIAVSILAEILLIKNHGSLRHRRALMED